MKFPVTSGFAVIGSLLLIGCTPLASPSSQALLDLDPEEIRGICNRRALTQTELAYLRARPDFAEILLLASDDCLAPGAIADSGGEPPGGEPPGGEPPGGEPPGERS